ncbi:MAG: hypothetical protein ACK5H2_06960 [Beutenbergiaceae bacterium]
MSTRFVLLYATLQADGRVVDLAADQLASAGEVLGAVCTVTSQEYPPQTPTVILDPQLRPQPPRRGLRRRLYQVWRLISGNRTSTRYWRLLRTNTRAQQLLADADIVVSLDGYSVEAAWRLAKSRKLRAANGVVGARWMAGER